MFFNTKYLEKLEREIEDLKKERKILKSTLEEYGEKEIKELQKEVDDMMEESNLKKDFGLYEIDQNLIPHDTEREIRKWFLNLIMKETNSHAMYCDESKDKEFATKVRIISMISKKFEEEFKMKKPDESSSSK